MKHISIVVPVYNERENIHSLITEVQKVFEELPYTYSFIIVDDGSIDGTLDVLRMASAADTRIRYISLSKNFGHQNALKAGLDHARGDCVITMDGDLQHPPALIPHLVTYWEQGYDVVYTLRQDDETNTGYAKRKTSRLFYKLMNRMADLDIEEGSADFRLLSKKVLYTLQGIDEHEIFFRGLVKWVGFRQIGVPYKAAPRTKGQSKYSFKKMMRFAVQGITSFSTKPLYIAAYLGLVFSFLALLYIPYALVSYLSGHVVNGWASIIVTIAFFGGLQLSILGIIGLYIGKIFMQVKKRPHYIIKELKHVQEAISSTQF
ncbi:MAG: glycosyltransferase family 2 protein [Flavisolibacter sp.]|nr:glycosyltransferase family 2 protein [Flavisolibacter sp.]